MTKNVGRSEMKILIEESVLRQALEAFGDCIDYWVSTSRTEYEDAMVSQYQKVLTSLRTAIDAAENVEPVAVVDANDDGYWADILPDRNVKVGQLLYPAPAIPGGWQPIETAPWETEVLLLGPSGYLKPHDKFFINGYRVRDWHQGDWNDATGTRLSECGWKPTHWMPLPPAPEIKP